MARLGQPFVNRQYSADIALLEAQSPDLLMDLGLLTHIIGKRDWAGNYQGWTDVPVTWLAKQSHTGTKRVNESLERLAAWGIIKPMSTNGKKGRMAPKYRYDLRPEWWGPTNELEAQLMKQQIVQMVEDSFSDNEEEVQAEVAVAPEPVAKPVTKPVVAEGIVRGTVRAWDPVTKRLQNMKVPLGELPGYPKCPECGEYMHPTEGVHAATQLCVDCVLRRVLEVHAEQPESTPNIQFMSPVGMTEYTVEEAQNWLETE